MAHLEHILKVISQLRANSTIPDYFVAISSLANIPIYSYLNLGYKPQDDGPSEYQTIPLSKIEDFGVHCKQYYSLEVSYFKSAMDKRLLDSLWNHYWVNTLSSSLLITNSEYTTGTSLF